MCNICKKKSIKLIENYQKYFSPDHSEWGKQRYPGGYCRYFPSCSEYTKQAIDKYGFMKGWGKGIWRVIRCNPFSKGGKDLP